MTDQNKKGALEAILFVAGEAVPVQTIAEVLEMTLIEADMFIESYKAELEETERGVELIRVGDKVQLRTNARYAKEVQKAIRPIQEKTLSQSVIETLSIIAYRQPITRTQIEEIKGVSADYSLRALLERKLIIAAGRADTIGKPLLYRPTDDFLRYFALESLADLPPLPQEEPLPV